MQLNTFSNGGLRFFFRKSFSALKRKNINNLIIDLRNNGGGYIFNSNLLIKYISRTPVLVADSIYAKVKSLKPFTHHFKMGAITSLGLRFMTYRKQNDHFEENQYNNNLLIPKNKNHYNGKLYVLISGPTFSASTLFANAVKGQSGIKLLGEETGGGWYGNGGVLIQDLVLPNTKLRLRMPLFKLVQYNHKTSYKGLGIPPDIYVPTSYDALIKGYDKKMKVAQTLIMQSLEK
jgi:C-terminal processing protease CtpA/Prc